MRVIGIIAKKYLMLTAAVLLLLSCLTLAACENRTRFIYDRDMWMRHSPWPDAYDPRSPYDSLPI